MVTAQENSAKPEQVFGYLAKTEPYARIGLWGWLGIYVTGAILLGFLFSHVWLIHYRSLGTITARTTAMSLQSLFIKTTELGLLVFAVVHAMLGTRRIILDMEVLRERGARFLSWFLVIIGVIIITSGLIIFNQLSSATMG